MRWSGSSERNLRVWVIVSGGEVDASRSRCQVERESGVVGLEARRDLLEREMRTREMLGNFWLRRESWERKWRPTPPAPGECQDVMKEKEVVLLMHAHIERKKFLKDSRVRGTKDFLA